MMATEARGDTGEISGCERAGGDGVGNKLEELRYRTFKLLDLR